jgi:hypothetical protein
MNKRDLLRSFSKVHNKKLRLLEQENDPRIQQAEGILAGVQFSQDPVSPYLTVGQTSDGKTLKYNPNSGKLTGANTFQRATYLNGKLSPPQGKNPEDAFNKMLGYLVDEASSEPDQPVIDPILDERLTELGVDIKNPELVQPLVTLLDRAKASNFGREGGKNAINLVRSLVVDYPVVVKEGEFYRVEPRESSVERTFNLAEALNAIGSEGYCDKFQRTDKGDMVVYTDFGEGQEGTVFSKGKAKAIANMISDCDDIEEINVIQEAAKNLGGESNIRGNTLEYPPDLFALSRTYFKNQESLTEEQREKSKKLIKDIANRIELGIRSLIENRETWLRTARDAAIPLESQAEFDKLMSLIEDNGKNIQASFHVASVSNKERLPDLSVRSGEVTRKGRKQDSVEIWYEEDAAAKALDQKKLESVDAKDLFDSLNKTDYYNELVEAGFLTPGQQVYVGEISYKNYIANAATVLGSFSDNNTGEFMSGRGQNPVWKTFTKQLGTTMTQYRSEFDAIHKEQMQIRKEIDSLSNNIEAKIDGKKVTVKALNTVIDATLENIQKNSTFTDMQRNELFKNLSELATKYKNAKTSKQKKGIESQMKATLLMPSLMGNLKQKGPYNKAVQIYALGLNYAAGASYSNNTVLQTNMLNEGISYTTTQNKAYQEIANSIKRDDGSWDLKITQSGLSFTRAENKKSSISLGMVRGNLQSRKSDTLTREGKKVRFLGSRQDASVVWDALGRLQEALGIIKEKVRVLDTH